MRIISGIARGRRLLAPAGEKTRPTSEQIRGAVFNILSGKVPNAAVLDLFGGTGALALEAMSRGAAMSVINDSDRRARDVILKNRQVVLGENSAACTVTCLDWRACLKKLSGTRFSLVFLDPPYAMTDVYGECAACLSGSGMLEEGAVLVMEYAAMYTPACPPCFRLLTTRKYGDTMIGMYEYAPDRPGEQPAADDE